MAWTGMYDDGMKGVYSGSGVSLALILVIVVGIAILAGIAIPKFTNHTEVPTSTNEASTGVTTRATEPAVSTRAACEARCRDQYGGSGSAGFDACIRACGTGGILREECPSERPACPSGESSICRRGVWYCRDAGARIFPETNNVQLNFPTDAQLRASACGEPALACESPAMPECKDGKWICVGPAAGVR